MKYVSGPLPAIWMGLVLLVVSGCSHSVLEYRNAEISDGLIYARGADEPFSGTVTHVPDSFMLNGEGYNKFMNEMGGAKYATARFVQAVMGVSSATLLCTISVRKGYVDGAVRCYLPQSDTQLIETHFVKGQLSGKFVYYNPEKSGEKLGEGSFEDGQPNEEQKIYSTSTGELMARVPWSHGLHDGDFVAYNEANGKVAMKGAFSQDQRDGTWKEYARAGKPLIAKESYSHGLLDGVQEVFDANTGKRTQLVDRWVEGRINGTRKTWDKQGVLLSEEVYASGVLVKNDVIGNSAVDALKQALHLPGTSSQQNVPSDPQACVDDWVKAQHKALGDDAMITADQLSEWKEWCSQGKSAPR